MYNIACWVLVNNFRFLIHLFCQQDILRTTLHPGKRQYSTLAIWTHVTSDYWGLIHYSTFHDWLESLAYKASKEFIEKVSLWIFSKENTCSFLKCLSSQSSLELAVNMANLSLSTAKRSSCSPFAIPLTLLPMLRYHDFLRLSARLLPSLSVQAVDIYRAEAHDRDMRFVLLDNPAFAGVRNTSPQLITLRTPAD